MKRRIEKVQDFIKQNSEIDGFWVSNIVNIRYLSGFRGSTAYIIITENEAIFITDGRYEFRVKNEISDFEIEIVGQNENYSEKLLKILRDLDVKKLGFEAEYISFQSYQDLKQKFVGIELIPLKNLILNLRLIKEEEEIEFIRKANEVSSKVLEKVLGEFKLDTLTEYDLALELEFQMRRETGEDVAFPIIVASGDNTAVPHAQPRKNFKIKNNAPLLIDFGAKYNGYCADITRTFWLGNKVDDEFKKIYEIVKKAQEIGIEYISPGKNAVEVDKKVRDFFKEKGLEEFFKHSLGHGLGLVVHEPILLSSKSKTPFELKENMVVTVEPGLYFEGKFGIRIEDDIVVKKGENLNLTPLSKEYKL